MKLLHLVAVACGLSFQSYAQTKIYVPGGTTSGIVNNATNSNVGIGSTSFTPAVPLHVKGATKFEGAGTYHTAVFDLNGTFSITSSGSSPGGTIAKSFVFDPAANSAITITHDDGSRLMTYLYNGGTAYTGLVNYSKHFVVGTATSNRMVMVTGNYERMRIDESGNVGIGTTAPAYKLDVTGTTRLNGNIAVSGNSVLEFGAGLAKEANAGKIGYRAFSNGLDIVGASETDGSNRRVTIYSEGGTTIYGGTRVTGRVSIGARVLNNTTYSPAVMLSVDGTAAATKLVCTSSNWADFVFEKNYSLAPLSEVESYINANKHLPGIPSASEVENGGLDTGEMIRLQMMKIEELTLHLIQQEKAMAAQQAEIKALKASLNK